MTSCSNSPLSKKESFAECSNRRLRFGCRAEKAQVTVLLPGNCSFSEWTDMVDCMPHSWPKSFNIGRMQMGPVQANTFHMHRKFTRARHMWLSLNPNWKLLSSHMYTDWPGIHSYEEINDRLFVNPGRNDNIQDTSSKAKWNSPEHRQWVNQQEYMWQFLDAQVPPVQITMEDTLAEYRANLRIEEAEIAAHSSVQCGRKRWKTKEGVYQLKHPEQCEQAAPTADDAIFADMLRDVRDNGIVMLEGLRHCVEHLRKGLCHCGEHLREALRGASSFRFTVSPASISKCFWAWFCLCWFVFLFGLCWVGVGFCFPRFRDHFSSFANTNDRQSCHGAHGMGEKKSAVLRVGWLKCSANLLTVRQVAKAKIRVNC